MAYDFSKIEKKWQTLWEKKKVHRAEDRSKKEKHYSLFEFPYPSGDGLHVGHIRPYIGMDVISRKRHMQGYNVLFPIGWDAFGLPTENYAIKTGLDPAVVTERNADNFRRQMQSVGLSLDWSREINTTDPDYYKWTQWLFLQFFNAGLAYKAKSFINWCPKDKIGLANEEVVGGTCERCGTVVEKREKEQWMLKITAYADKLLEGLKEVDFLPEIKRQQENWIGRSEGASIKFEIRSTKSETKKEYIEIFTTRPDTIFGATYAVLTPEHSIIENLKLKIENWPEVEEYIKESKKKPEEERIGDKEKTGVELKGIKAINPATKEEVPVFVADYVLGSYGTGAIMAVPAHDERDFAFAKKYGLLVKAVVEPMITKVGGDDGFKEGKEVSERNAVVAIIKHWSEDKYLGAEWLKTGWRGFVIGGIEKGEDAVTAGLRETTEETGYKNPEFVQELGGTIHARFFQTVKNENRLAHFTPLLFKLKDGAQEEVNEEDKKLHAMKWLSPHEFDSFITNPDMRIAWNRVTGDHIYSGDGPTDGGKFDHGGILINSGKFDGLAVTKELKEKITEFVHGSWVTKYKLRDWVFSRQRYWGEPIPLVFCENCAKNERENPKHEARNPKSLENSNLDIVSNFDIRISNFSASERLNHGWVPVPEKDLPVKLPKVEKYEPTDTGESPLAKVGEWVKTTCPTCKGPARRETDTMPNWAGSSWYYLAYLFNEKGFKKSTSLENWKLQIENFKHFMPVDWYNGGMEHVTLHLLYSRFWNLFLYDQGLVPVKEPYKKRTAHGLILAENGAKMSKSRGNVVSPDALVAEYGADALRVYEMFMGPFSQAIAWNTQGILGMTRFLERVWRLQEKITNQTRKEDSNNLELERLLHKTIKKVSEDIETMSFNTAISAMMILVNEMERSSSLSVMSYELLVKLLNPFAPHLAHELWESLGNKTILDEEEWPTYDPKLIEDDMVELLIQVNGKLRGKILVPKDISQADAEAAARADIDVAPYLKDGFKKTIFVPGRLINFVV